MLSFSIAKAFARWYSPIPLCLSVLYFPFRQTSPKTLNLAAKYLSRPALWKAGKRRAMTTGTVSNSI